MQNNKTMKAYRQGEVLLLQTNKTPKGKVEKKIKYIVAHSETGHHHVLEAPKGTSFDVVTEGENTYLVLETPMNLVHQKTQDRHNDIVVSPGAYIVKGKTEYLPFDKLTRRVQD